MAGCLRRVGNPKSGTWRHKGDYVSGEYKRIEVKSSGRKCWEKK